MTKTIYISFLIFLAFSCTNKLEVIEEIDWKKELVGIGYLGVHPDSLNLLFSYSPHSPHLTYSENEFFNKNTVIYGDTITIPNFLIHHLFGRLELGKKHIEDSSFFLLEKDSLLYKFKKIKGQDIVPNILYFQKSPTTYPNSFKYCKVNGLDISGQYAIEIIGKDSIKAWFKSSAYFQYLYEQYEFSETDHLFINSFLNLAIKNRYDTVGYYGLTIQGATMDETIIYNDSVFRYDLTFQRSPSASSIVGYFRQKINFAQHHKKQNEVGFDVVCPFKLKRFPDLPIAVERSINYNKNSKH